MCKIIITYKCGCKPYTGRLPCKNNDCDTVKERRREPNCAMCEKLALEDELARGERNSSSS
ncbi:Uu.00g110390.m01.CDS01 [Anthostomella pinea]|uniref:Uu.00g110390.m01.CDS01 n=1 Tax=Anthostomella pinea TaxID=933095 RepID=A0AAI8YG99_9PEZI|nr:Uu.00g110390.m01.CDS01 [Anthostomella pinea]